VAQQSTERLPVVVVGAFVHGKVVCEVLQASGATVIGFVDDDPTKHGTEVLGLPVLGPTESLAGRAVSVALGIGDNIVRAMIARKVIALGLALRTGVHPTASVSPTARLGRGTVVMAQAAINAEARIGEGVIVNTGAVVEHDCIVGDFAHVSPGSTMGGKSRLGSSAQLGIGATLLPRTAIGEGSIVGAGATVVRDLADGVIAYGVPARAHRKVSS
jgi:sugar O-acyltransferase (sialic acid O-acetyltransferase NeuD family)